MKEQCRIVGTDVHVCRMVDVYLADSKGNRRRRRFNLGTTSGRARFFKFTMLAGCPGPSDSSMLHGRSVEIDVRERDRSKT